MAFSHHSDCLTDGVRGGLSNKHCTCGWDRVTICDQRKLLTLDRVCTWPHKHWCLFGSMQCSPHSETPSHSHSVYWCDHSWYILTSRLVTVEHTGGITLLQHAQSTLGCVRAQILELETCHVSAQLHALSKHVATAYTCSLCCRN